MIPPDRQASSADQAHPIGRPCHRVEHQAARYHRPEMRPLTARDELSWLDDGLVATVGDGAGQLAGVLQCGQSGVLGWCGETQHVSMFRMLASLPAWVFPEFSPVGVDLDSLESVEDYDRNQGTQAAKDDALLDRLSVGPGTVFVDLGTGTGSLPVRAALRGVEAHAVDVSANMLAFTQRRAADAGIEVLQQHAGFLSHTFEPGSVDVVATRSALHQLPDTWKQVALNRIAAMLRPGGVLYLWDVMWSFSANQLDEQLPAWIDAMARPAGEGFTREMFETHVREEFSTFTWIIEGMIERAGLRVIESDFPAPWYGELLAERP